MQLEKFIDPIALLLALKLITAFQSHYKELFDKSMTSFPRKRQDSKTDSNEQKDNTPPLSVYAFLFEKFFIQLAMMVKPKLQACIENIQKHLRNHSIFTVGTSVEIFQVNFLLMDFT